MTNQHQIDLFQLAFQAKKLAKHAQDLQSWAFHYLDNTPIDLVHGSEALSQAGHSHNTNPYMILMWQCWRRSEPCAQQMDSLFFHTSSYTQILYRAMSILFHDANNKPGIVYNGALLPHANNVVAWNGGRMNGFSQYQMQMCLTGWFTCYTTGLGGGEGPYHPDPGFNQLTIDVDSNDEYAQANQPGQVIKFNSPFHASIASSLGFPVNDTGVDMLTWVTGCTLLHEIMHNMGYSHPAQVNYTPGSDYASSLPYVAERAVLEASPYWNQFKAYYDGNMWLTGDLQRTCGTFS